MANLMTIRDRTPRWVILFLDLSICFVSIILAYLLRFNFKIPSGYLNLQDMTSLYYVLPVVLSIRFISFIFGKTYLGLIRYTSSQDAGRIFFVLLIGSFVFFLINLLSAYLYNRNFIPMSIIAIDLFITIVIMTGFRLTLKALYLDYTVGRKTRKNTIIIGIGNLAITAKRTLSKDKESNYKILAFVDLSNDKFGTKIEGLNVHKIDELEDLIENRELQSVILAEENISPSLKNKIADICLNNNVDLLTLPSVTSWINGNLSTKQIKEIRIEDLLARPPIKLDKKEIGKYTLNKTILVTGAAGSIGSEIVKQLAVFKPKNIIIFDQAESPLYDLELDLQERYHFNNFKIIIGDLTHKSRIENVFINYKPDVVFHAAAYKHVPMMENHPSEAIRANVFGTKTIADLAIKYGVYKFVMVSTDKAVNPTNVMGASKRLAEIYTQSLNSKNKTKFVTTRFGNVLGSNGSVINRFRKQIQKGGPVTVTHPEITRFFMTIPEACQLVLEAGAMGKGGEIFIFDMGKSVKIVDLAKNMIKLSGLKLGEDINIIYTGLRPGEKLYEELLNNEENTLPTHHSQIMIGKVEKYELSYVEKAISDLIELGKTENDFDIVRKMKEIVPEFTSKNSIFEELDYEKEDKGKETPNNINNQKEDKDQNHPYNTDS